MSYGYSKSRDIVIQFGEFPHESRRTQVVVEGADSLSPLPNRYTLFSMSLLHALTPANPLKALLEVKHSF